MENSNPWVQVVQNRLNTIYGDSIKESQINKFIDYIKIHIVKPTSALKYWDETDIALITYGDSIINKNEIPLKTLHRFSNNTLRGIINIIHILPFFPFSSDDGFSVIDFESVNTELGTWNDIEEVSSEFKLMADLVINHASSQSSWFQNFLKGSGEGDDFFIEESPEADLSNVTRPRSTPLLTKYKTNRGDKFIWTTFSDDQIDLNFANPEVLLKFLKILHTYIQKGAKIIRLDAIAFLWKEVGTTCLHLEQTHEVVKFLRNFVEWVSPGTLILTETNVPNKENLSYFGNGDEAHMVYQFSLPPLLLHALNSGNGSYLSQWAGSLPDLEENCTFFNFTSSHDGIGVRPLEGLLPEDEKIRLFKDIKASGGHVSMKKNSDGTESPYELNITYYDAMKLTISGPDNWQEQRFLCSQVIMLSMKGVPAFYIHSLLASSNNYKGVEATGRARTINREKLDFSTLQNDLIKDSTRGRIFNELKIIINIRKSIKAFHPSASQTILDLGSSFFAFERTSLSDDKILSISNLTSHDLEIKLPQNYKSFKFDIITQKEFHKHKSSIEPYQTLWLIQ